MPMKYFDAHCHVQFDAYDPDRLELIERMREREVGGIVVGVDKQSSEQAVALVQNHEHLYASVGLHPNRANEWFERSEYAKLAENPKVVAIGECGLDYFRPEDLTEAIKNEQELVLKEHFILAGELDKPLIIHARPSKGTMDAYEKLIDMLTEAKKQYPKLSGDIHFFVGGVKEAEALFKLGFTVSYTAVITFARDYDEVIRTSPLTNLLSETDSPYVAPLSRRGKRNDPIAVEEVVAKIAELRGEPLESVQTALLENAKRLFRM